ncbi:retrotransposon-related protein [Tanacetum coccineum]
MVVCICGNEVVNRTSWTNRMWSRNQKEDLVDIVEDMANFEEHMTNIQETKANMEQRRANLEHGRANKEHDRANRMRTYLRVTPCYYRRFIKDYAGISQPLTALLNKNAFLWSNEAQVAFEQLQQAMCQAPVLALPNFQEEFIIETDASGYGIGAVLQQKGHPIAFLSKTLAPRHQSLSAYEKELLAVVVALQKWRGYLLDRHFKIRTDHFSLNPKGGELLTIITALPSNEFIDTINSMWSTDPVLSGIIKDLQDGSLVNSKYTWQDEQLKRKGKWVVGPNELLRNKMVLRFHSSAVGGHSGVQATFKRLSSFFYWKGMRKSVKEVVRTCDVCQRNKSDLSVYPGLLQPLPIPNQIWQDISMDLIDSLPVSQGKSTVLVVVDRLSKQSHFIPVTHPYTAKVIAQLFLDNNYKLHGLPKTIVSDKDKIFLSLFWHSLFKMLKVGLKFSTAYHPQTDGQTEVVNKCLEGYLRCMTGENPKEWVQWLPLAECWYNTNFHSATHTTPYEIVYGQPPPLYIPYMSKDSRVDLVDKTLVAKEKAIDMLKFNLDKAQNRMKVQADKHRSEREFSVGDWVYLKLQPYRQLTIKKGKQHKLSAKFYGPFLVIGKVGQVAYRLQLPPNAKVHSVFHVSQLKKCLTPNVSIGVFPECDAQGLLAAEPFKLLERKIVKQQNGMGVFGLIQ